MTKPVGQITIIRRFRGPLESGNGGYVCGRLANFIQGPAEVKLKLPPPLETPMDVVSQEDGSFHLLWQGKEVAEARPAKISLDIPKLPTLDEAELASRHFLGFKKHYYPTCFVCGPKRDEVDALQIFPGQIGEENKVVAPWMPDKSLANENGWVAQEFIWASLDCPGAFAAMLESYPEIVLGTLAVEIVKKVKPETSCIVMGWEIGKEGRKHFVGTALFTEAGELIAKGKATWIQLTNLE